jgi:hypothetical protein
MADHWKMGKPSVEAAILGASERLRPILMTACAMTVGMVPMALALERGSQMQAPLGLAVIGGLVMSTFATLLVLPSIFAVVIGRKEARSPSMYPDDRESAHFDPLVYAQVDENDKKVVSSDDYAAWERNGGKGPPPLVAGALAEDEPLLSIPHPNGHGHRPHRDTKSGDAPPAPPQLPPLPGGL